MMKKKNRTLMLLVAVILIYGAVIVRFIFLSGDSEAVFVVESKVGQFRPIAYDVDQKFTVKNNFRDPFLGTLPRKTSGDISENTFGSSKKTIQWPIIVFKGLVSDVNSTNKIFAVVLNGKEMVVKEGQVMDSVKILNGTSKELILRYKGEKRKIERS